jgi:hypothetical protein
MFLDLTHAHVPLVHYALGITQVLLPVELVLPRPECREYLFELGYYEVIVGVLLKFQVPHILVDAFQTF